MAFDLEIAAATVFMEASGESSEGQRAVAHVLNNRLKTGRWPTLAAVCLSPSQFSCWNTNDPNRRRLATTNEATLAPFQQLVHDVLAGVDADPTDGATFYYAPDAVSVTPAWVADMTQTAQIGKQVFFKLPNYMPGMQAGRHS